MGQWGFRLVALLLLLRHRQGGESPPLTIRLFLLGVVGLCVCGGLVPGLVPCLCASVFPSVKWDISNFDF